MTEDIMNEIENSMVTGLGYEEPYPEPAEPEFEEHPDPKLNDTLTDIARLSAQTDKLDEIYTGLLEGCYQKRQAE